MKIKRVSFSDPEYLKLRELWCESFGDEPGYVDGLYAALGAAGYVGVAETAGLAEASAGERTDKEFASKIVTSLTIYDAGEFEGQTVAVVYAVCTTAEARGKGYASELVRAALADIRAAGKLALTSPAEESLAKFYEKLGFGSKLYVDEQRIEIEADEQRLELEEELKRLEIEEEDDGFVPAIGTSVEQIDARRYGELREEFLVEYPHIKLNKQFLEFIKSESYDGNGLLLVNSGDAICVLADSDSEELHLMELLVNPRLEAVSSEIGESIARGLAELFETKRVSYRTKAGQNSWASAARDCGADALETKRGVRIQSLASGNEALEGAYFGFALD